MMCAFFVIYSSLAVCLKHTTYLSTYLPIYPFAHLTAYVYLSTHLLTYPPAYLPSYIPTGLSIYPYSHLYLITYLLAYQCMCECLRAFHHAESYHMRNDVNLVRVSEPCTVPCHAYSQYVLYGAVQYRP